MRICHVITRLILGGAQENTILTCEGLRARGHEVTLVTGPALGPEGQLMDRANAGGYRVVVIDEMRREINLSRDRITQMKLTQLLDELRPDIVHTHSSKAGIIARKAASRAGGSKIIHTVHGLPFHAHERWWLNKLYVALERRAARRTDAIICVADAMTAQSLAAGVGRPEQYSTVYSGMEVAPFLNRPDGVNDFRSSLRLPAGAVLVTQVSRLAELKGHEYIIEAAKRIRNEHVYFCFVGDGRLRSRLEADIAQAGLTERFRLTGLLPPERIPAVMHGTDILVHCSLREGLARTLPQAMLAGRPVVSFDVDGAREVVNDATGIPLPAKDVDKLTAAVESLAADPARREKLGSAGRELCRSRFDHNVMVEQIESLYRKLIG